MASAQGQFDTFVSRLRGRLVAGLNGATAEFTANLDERLSEKQAYWSGGTYFGSKPGEHPAKYRHFLVNALGSSVDPEVLEATIGFVTQDAAQKYKWLVGGTENIEPRAGPSDLWVQIRALLQQAFYDNARNPKGQETPF